METTVLAIGGGKGGTGKSLLAVQLGIELAARDAHVVLVDADWHGANLHTFFGLEDPAIALEWILQEKGEPTRAVLPTGTKQLGLVAGLRELRMAMPNESAIRACFERLRSIPADFLIIDVGSGCNAWSTLLFELADVGLLVSQPEPTCIERDYHFLRHVYRWRLAGTEVAQTIPNSGWLPVPWLTSLGRVNKELALSLQTHLRRSPLLLVMNQTHEPEDRELGEEMMSVLRRFYGLHGEAVGWLEHDERVWLAGRQRQPVAHLYPESSWMEQLQRVVEATLPFLTGESK